MIDWIAKKLGYVPREKYIELCQQYASKVQQLRRENLRKSKRIEILDRQRREK